MSQTVIVNRLPSTFELLRFARTWLIRAFAVVVDTRVRVATTTRDSSALAAPVASACGELLGRGAVAEAGAVPARRATAHPIARAT